MKDERKTREELLRDLREMKDCLIQLERSGAEQKLLEEELRQARERTEAILASVADIHILFDRQWRYLYVNGAAVRSLGRPRDQILGRTLWELFPDIIGTELERQYHRGMDERVSVEFDFYYPATDTWWNNRFSPTPEGLAVFAINITERKHAEEEVRTRNKELACLNKALRRQHEQIRALAARVAETGENERQRIARELHDQVGQNLTAIGISLNMMKADLSVDAVGAAGYRLDDSLLLLGQVTESIRGVMGELRPPLLDEFGVVAALKWYGARFSSRTGIPVSVHGEDMHSGLAERVQIALFRIFQEALTNVARHAKAGRIRVTLEEDKKSVRLSIADDGIGFDASDLRRLTARSRWGIFNMRERAEVIGGKLRIESRPGKGTRVAAEVPR
jgi:PAS domain S-box-containing protein